MSGNWRPSVRLSVSPVFYLTLIERARCVLNATHQGASRDAASVQFSRIITKTDVLVPVAEPQQIVVIFVHNASCSEYIVSLYLVVFIDNRRALQYAVVVYR